MTHSLPHRRTSVMSMSDKTFDFLRFVAQVVLPGLGALYFGIAEIWDLPFAAEIVGTIAVVDTFLGLLLGYQRRKYLNSDAAYDGTLQVTPRPDPQPDLYSLDLSTPLIDVPEKQAITLRVNSEPEDPSQ